MKRIALIAVLAALASPAMAQPFGYYTNGNNSIYGNQPYAPTYHPLPGMEPEISQFAPPQQYMPQQRMSTCTYAGNHVFCN